TCSRRRGPSPAAQRNPARRVERLALGDRGEEGGHCGLERKICQYCEKPSYSAVSYTQVWTCAYCDGEFRGVVGEDGAGPLPGPATRGREDSLGDTRAGRQPDRGAA